MVYECEKCGAALPPAAMACPQCGDSFEEAVPSDAEVPEEEFTAPQLQTLSEQQVPIDSIPTQTQRASSRPQLHSIRSRRPRWIASLAIIGLAILAILFFKSIKDTPSSKSPASSVASHSIPLSSNTPPHLSTLAPVSNSSGLKVLTHIAGLGENGKTFISGKVRNDADHAAKHAQIVFIIYDKDSHQIGSAKDTINDLEPNGIWSYKAIVVADSHADHYKLAGVTSH